MSKFLQPPLYKGKAIENQWKNLIFTSHDLLCGCNSPIKHLFHLFEEKCHHTADTTPENGDPTAAGTTEEDFNLDEGDLDQLFTVEKENSG